ncbi:hypothetical protein NS506_02664 [Nocardia seriolae]|uniref:Uncharacterized protein n=1 Tax=Nocardia seriolae TaxID=37332 RepID=A0ABC8ARH2_9NOCA|nr:hypothetical protein [Nocardia seriolae]APA96726.1 hypothetical protein NS506_02664 [Nocardia seriolae]
MVADLGASLFGLGGFEFGDDLFQLGDTASKLDRPTLNRHPIPLRSHLVQHGQLKGQVPRKGARICAVQTCQKRLPTTVSVIVRRVFEIGTGAQDCVVFGIRRRRCDGVDGHSAADDRIADLFVEGLTDDLEAFLGDS